MKKLADLPSFARADSPGTLSPIADRLGSAVALTDAAGIIQTQYSYEPFGKTTAIGASSTNPSQYTSRENDWTGLYYYRARYYSPGLHRFIGQDPAEFVGGYNLYAYVGNSPINLAGPSGMMADRSSCTGRNGTCRMGCTRHRRRSVSRSCWIYGL
ncbi:MAG: RHS repeat-associated core domain-containing protein [Acidobacteriota bacterium]